MNNTRQTELLLDKSDHTKNWIVIISGFLIAVTVWSMFLFAQDKPYLWLNGRFLLMRRDYDVVIRFGIALAMTAIGALVLFLLMFKYARVNAMMQDGRPPPSVRFEQETTPPNVHLESTQGNQMLLSRYKFSRRQWWKLINALRNWGRVWSRDHSLHESGIFTAAETGLILNASNVYPDLRDDFERMGIIRKRGGSWHVTEMGWTELHKSAGSKVIT